MKQKQVLVLGATGRVARLLRRQLQVKPLLNTEFIWAARRTAPGVDRVIATPGDVENLPQCQAVLALWGPVSGPEAVLDGNISLAHAAQRIGRACGADRVLHASSAAVYAPSPAPLDETAPCAPRNAYGAAKLRMEQAVRGAAPRPVCLRIGNVAGADGLLSTMAEKTRVTLDQFEDGQGPRRSYLQLATLAQVVAALVHLPAEALPEVLNVAGEAPVAMADLVRASGRALDWRAAPPEALPVMALDVSRLMALVPLDPPSRDAGAIIREWQALGGQA